MKNSFIPTLVRATALLLALLPCSPSLQAVGGNPLTVGNTEDAGPGSLRQAILQANADTGAQVIRFDIPGPGPHTVALQTPLPPLTDPLTIDGWSQPGFQDTPQIRLDGAAIPTAFGLDIRTRDCMIRGLAIGGLPAPGGSGYAIRLSGADTTGNWILGCHLGANPRGDTAAPNAGGGVWITAGASGNRIGSDLDGVDDGAEANLISGNLGHGVLIESDGNMVAGNLIGSDRLATTAMPNRADGIHLRGGSNRVEANLISGNRGHGVFLRGLSARLNVIVRNRIGVDGAGGQAVPNRRSGVALSGDCRDNRIGGDHSLGNVISGNLNDGITVGFVIGEAPPLGTIIAGNLIGTDATGSVAIGNGDSGVYIVAGQGTRIGTDGNGVNDAAEGNVLSGNPRAGVTLDGASGATGGNLVAGNRIGLGLDPAIPLPNAGYGVRILNQASENRIGGLLPGMGNQIAHNPIGILIESGQRNRLLANSLFSATQQAIDLGNDGVTLNDPGDGDSGPNQLQNFPMLTGADAGNLSGTLNSSPNTRMLLQFFANTECDPSGFGQAEQFVDAFELMTDPAGNASFSHPLTFVPGKPYVTAIATDADGNSSELSACLLVNRPPVAVPSTVQGLEDEDVLIQLEATDPDNDPLVARILSLPANGALYQVSAGGRGPPIASLPATVSHPDRLLFFVPLPDANGNSFDQFDFLVNDGSEDSAPATLSLDIVPVNDPPSFTPGPDLVLFEDIGQFDRSGWAQNIRPGPPNEIQDVRFLAQNDNPALFTTQPGIRPDGTLFFQSAADQNGAANVTVLLEDDGGTAFNGQNQSAPVTFRIVLKSINDPPTFELGPDIEVDEDSGPQVIHPWLRNLSPGPADEAAQILTLETVSSHPLLFSQPPVVTSEGALLFTPATDAFGVAEVTLFARDNGGSGPNGGNQSPPRTFRIQVQPVNDCPSPRPARVSTREEQALPLQLTGVDPEEDPLTFQITTPPVHGTLEGNPPALTYIPEPGFCGRDQFEFTVRDGDQSCPAETARIELEIECVNDCPTAQIVALPPARLEQDRYVLISADNQAARALLDGSTSWDPEADPLTYLWLEGPADALNLLGNDVVASAELRLGWHTVRLFVMDADCLDEATATIEVIRAGEAVEACVQLVAEANLPRKERRPIVEAMKKAVSEFDKGRFDKGIRNVEAALRKLDSKQDKEKIDPAVAEPLMACIADLLDRLLAAGGP